jgi:uncharacterized protein
VSERVDLRAEADHGFLAEWQRWRTERLAAVNALDGPPTLAATHWLDETESVPGVPGLWLGRGAEVVLVLPRGAEAIVAGVPRSGELVALRGAEEVGPRIHLAGLTVQVTTRSGRRGVRVFDHARAGSVSDIEAFEPSPSWVIEGSFAPLGGKATHGYSYALESGPRRVEVAGVVSFLLSGRRVETMPLLDEGDALLVFSDRTTGQTTKPPSRFLTFELPAGGGRRAASVWLDFNRAFLPPCAFSDHFNCPLPPAEHRLGVAVTAGETWPRRRGGDGMLVEERARRVVEEREGGGRGQPGSVGKG